MYVDVGLDLTQKTVLCPFAVLDLVLERKLFAIVFYFFGDGFLGDIGVDLLDVLNGTMSTSSRKLYASLTASFSLFLSQLIRNPLKV